MNKPMAVIGVILGGLTLLSAGYVIGDDDRDDGHREAQRLLESGAILPLETVLEKARSTQPGRILEVELEREGSRFIYEIELLDEAGVVWELELDAVSGELVKKEKED